MRISFYAPLKPPTSPSPSGDRRIARLLMRAIGGAGHAITLASRLRTYEGNGDAGRQLQLKAEAEREAAGMLEAFAKDAVPTPDVWFTYHIYHKAPDWIGPIVAAELGIPYVVAEASIAPKRAGGPWDMGYRASLRSVGAADLVIGFNETDAACVKPHLKPGATYTHVPPFIDTEPYVKARQERSVYRGMASGQYGLPTNEPWLLAVGMMRPGDKAASYRQLAEALSGLMDRPWRLLVVGDGEARPEVRQVFAGLESRIAWLGAQDQAMLAGLYAAADLYVWPAVNEAFGMAFLEAQAAGLPVIAADDGGVAGVVAAPRGGTLVAKGDTAAFATAVAAMLIDGEKRAAMGKAAQEAIVDGHGLMAASRQIDRLLIDVARSAPR